MSTAAEAQLVKALTHAHAMELHEIRLLEAAARAMGTDAVAEVYGDHLLETVDHERRIADRLAAHGGQPAAVPELPPPGDCVAHAVSDTPIMLAATAFAFESHEIASYRLLGSLARRAGDDVTAAVVAGILVEEEAAAARVAATFERALELALAERATVVD
jgi:ferritin-like metal-binding protein YciE